MKSVKPTKAWSISLLICGLCSLIISITNIIGADLPDMLKRILGVAELVSLPVLVYTSVKMFTVRDKQ
ncbi:MAG: hypothetical protein J5926_04415 [Ruminococcus sp.]|nr:hypothetical protein [Ruminococcus sp.]